MDSDDGRPLLRFPHGAVRVTEMLGVDNDPEETVSLADILEAASLKQALVTSFLVDDEWLAGHFRDSTPVTLVTNPDTTSNSNSGRGSNPAHTAASCGSTSRRFRRVHPEFPKGGFQIMHSKIMLLFYARSLRFVAGSANLIPDDWSVMQNSLFVQDFRLDRRAVFPGNEFSFSLAYALHDLSVPAEIVALLNNVDFSAARIRIVTSVPTGGGGGGVRRNMNMPSYGMERLAEVVADAAGDSTADLGGADLKTPAGFQPTARLLCVGSSLGQMDTKWLRDFYLCAHGLPDIPKTSLGAREKLVPDDLIDIGIGFHTQEDVEGCRYSAQCGSYIMLSSQVYGDEREFPRSSLCRVVPRVDGTLVHAKAIVARFGEKQNRGWVYVGSHNFTPAAWGRLRIGHATYFNNYEFGVVLPNTQYTRVTTEETAVSWDSENIPLPFRLVWQPYSRSDVPHFSK
ncbi:hypothetical protein H4217_000149 [Coemansia sp. RSA 1939]|nr:hypothetical protein H4217_000149 [Coemansia sp. RSA 1939]KAJ2617952.1 hypothetical protein EV177_000262 [Coemansia sp. RSA 1804]KAJ2694990.1 hypothetical protein GGH99_000380 [Coemansia sp. RSA 1285]